MSFLEKNYNEFISQNNKQSVEEILFQRAVKTTIQILYYKGLCDIFQNTDEVLKIYCLPQDEIRDTYNYLSFYTRVCLQIYD